MPDADIISLDEYRKGKERADLILLGTLIKTWVGKRYCPLCQVRLDNIEGMTGFGYHPKNGCKFAGMFRLEK